MEHASTLRIGEKRVMTDTSFRKAIREHASPVCFAGVEETVGITGIPNHAGCKTVVPRRKRCSRMVDKVLLLVLKQRSSFLVF